MIKYVAKQEMLALCVKNVTFYKITLKMNLVNVLSVQKQKKTL
jgi:hypothetical protein